MASVLCFLMSDRIWNLLLKPNRGDNVEFKTACMHADTHIQTASLLDASVIALLISAAVRNRGS